MSLQSQFDAFLSAMYKDSHLKNRIILWTFLILVFPTAFLVAAGVPEKPAYIAMAALVLPLQILIYSLTLNRDQQTASIAVREVALKFPETKTEQKPTRQDGWESPETVAQRLKERVSRSDLPSARKRFTLPWGDEFRSDIILTHPDSDASNVMDFLTNLKAQDRSMIFFSHHGSFSGWAEVLGDLKVQSGELSPVYVTYGPLAHADLRPENVLAPALLVNADRLMESVLREQAEKEMLKRAEKQRQQASQGFMSATLSTTAAI